MENIKTIGRVYMIISPSNRVYIGSTTQSFKQRWSHYYKLQCKSQIKLYNSLKKYNPINHIFLKVWEGDIKNMYKIEATIGREFRVLTSKYGLNCRLPKIDDIYKNTSEETRKKIGLASKNRTEESREKSRQSTLNRSPEINKKISNTLKNRKQTLSQIQNAAETRYKKIIQTDLKGNFIKEWNTTLEIKNELNINPENVRRCCRGTRKTYKKYNWKYK
jgi:group I intron endonuclease